MDELRTSDDWLLEKVKDADVYELHYRLRRNLRDQLTGAVARLTARGALPWQRPTGLM